MLKSKVLGSLLLSAIISIIFTMVFSVTASAYTMKQAPIMTQWASQINTANPLPEYPRPQLTRNDWQNLNGIWQFKSGTASDSVPVGQNLSGDILVPYPMESAISGVMAHHDRAWYRRTFTVPTAWSGKRIMLNFGAVDWEAQVYINGTSLGIHKGGYDAFSYDITPYLVGTGNQELIVRVYDPTDAYGQPRGKQTLYPGGITYTASSGIWQTVWMEPVAATNISSLKITPDIDNNRLKLRVNTAGSTTGITVTATAKIGSTTVGTISGNPNTELYISIPNAKLWSPSNPFLYDLTVDLKNGSTTVDTVNSYFGMRKISLVNVGGIQKTMLNNQFLFEMGPLDQGYWPDGLYTAPTDAALKFDIEQEKALGFNMVRKHVKIEPQRWYYWADKLGIMVWQDMPSPNCYMASGIPVPPIDKPQFELELNKMITTHYNSPSIIMWVVFNEAQGQYDTERLAGVVAGLDNTRLVNSASGWDLYNAGNIMDVHSYPSPACPTSSTQARACGEYGGIGYQISGHVWNPNSWGYTMVYSGEELASLYDEYTTSLASFKANNGMSAAVYTEITDVEGEINGLITYDRKVIKANSSKIRVSNEKVINSTLTVTSVLPTSQTTGRTWKYTNSAPASNWNTSSFNDTAWASGQAGFGGPGTPGGVIRTNWTSSDIWMRQTFNPGTLTATDISNLAFVAHHDEDFEVYINGVLATSKPGYTSGYNIIPMNQAGKNAIISNANNVIAVHCRQVSGGQYIDVGISKLVFSGGQAPTSSFSDNFDDGNANGWTNYDGTWSVASGQYNVGSYFGAKSIANGTNLANFSYEADVSINGGDAGIMFRVLSPSNGVDSYLGYYAGISATQVVLGKVGYGWNQIAATPMTITPNTMYHIKVVAVGSNIKVYVTDMNTPKINATDVSFTSGAIGVRTVNSAAKFDNIRVTACASFYQDLNYGGTGVSLLKGNYTMAQMTAAGIPNDWITSLRVPSGLTVELYQHDNFTGTKWTFTSDSGYVGDAVNDQTTSIKIY